MSKKQSLLTLLALITLIVNIKVRASSLIVAQPEERLPLKPCKLPAVKEVVLCGNYEVWENRETLKGRKISIYVVVLPAFNPNPAPDPLFAISGGPGQAATEVFLNGFAEIRKNRDIVLIDQRGTGGSNSLACDAANLQELVQIIVGEDAPRESIRRCRAHLEQKADLRMYATPAAVEDLDEVRKWLGYKTINLYGGSYGSRVALVYLRRFPQHVRTVTLRAVYPTTIPVPLYAPRYNQRSLDRLLDDCARDEKCSQSFPDLKQDFQTALDLLASSPEKITVTDPRANKPVELAITRGVFAGAIRQLLLDSNSQRFIPVIVRGAAKRDYAPLKTLVGQALRTIGGINFGMNTSVICSEEIPRINPADIKREAAGAFLTGSVVQTRIDLCREWPRGRTPANYFEPVKSNVPVLLISGELDPATPFEWGDEAARHLPNSMHIIQPGVAHGPFTSCAQNVMNRFVDVGTTAGLDATCVKELKRPAFLTPPQSQQPQNESALQSAIQQFEAKQYPEAKAALEQLTTREPKNATAVFYLGRIAFERNNADEAVKWFETAVRLDDKRAVHHHWLAQAYGKKARAGGMMSRASFAGKARDALLKSLELDPGALDARADLARYYNSVPGILGGSAERAMEQVEIIKQRDALKGWLLAGELLADKKKLPEAERALLEAEKRQSDQFEATYKLGDFYQLTKEFDKAFAAFDRVLRANPDDLRATYQIGRAAGMSGKNLDRGLEAFEAVKDRLTKENHDALVGLHWWRGKIYEAKGEREKAYADYVILDRLSPGYAETRAAIERTMPPANVAGATSARRVAGLVSLKPSTFVSYAGEMLDCELGRLLAPENRDKKNDRLLDLAFVRLKSASKTPQSPVVFLAGGPGASGIQTGRLPDYFQTIKAILEHADVILLDQRGTGASTPEMGCLGTVADLPATALRSREDMRLAFIEMARKCAEEKRARGVDFDGFTILESADDVDDLRRALGLKKVSLWGHSYGTQLAFATARRHEAAIDRLIVMSVEGVAGAEKLPGDVDRYFEQIAAMCWRDAQVPDLMGLMRNAFMTLDRTPVTVSVTHPATGVKRELIVGGDGLRMLTLLTAMNDTRNLPLIPLLFVTLSRGDTSGLAEMLSAWQGRGIPSADWFLIDGASGATAGRRAQIRREARASLFGDLVNFLLTDLRAVWSPKDLGDDFRKPVKSKVPALFISGALDANTPPHRAEEARKGFPNSAHLIIENAGHQDALRSAGVVETIAAFVQGRKIGNKTFAMPVPEFAPPARGQ